MKKLILLFSIITSFLFVSCNSIYNNHHRTTKLIINLPKAANYSSRQIYKGDSLDVNTENATFSVQLKRSDGAILGPYYNNPNDNTIIIPDVTPGIWTVSAFASVENHEDFAFDSKELIIKAGDIKNITLSLTKNLISKIVNITLEKEINKTSYELGSSIDPSGAEFRVHLSNGYSFVYDKEQLTDFEITTEIGFSSTADTDVIIANGMETTANYGLFNTVYKLSSETLEPEYPESTFRFPIIITKKTNINAKTPVIKKNPSSTYFHKGDGSDFSNRIDTYSFSVEIEKNAYYTMNNITVEWYGPTLTDNVNKDVTLEELDDSYISTVTYTLHGYKSVDVEEVYKYYNYYTVTNTDNREGINNEHTSSISSKNNNNGAYVICYSPEQPFGAAINHNYYIDNDAVSVKYNGNFVYSENGTLPSQKDFIITLTYKTYDKGNPVTVDFRADDGLFSAFTINQITNLEQPTYGNIKYQIAFGYNNYSGIINGSAVYEYSNEIEEYSGVAEVPTILPKVEESLLSLMADGNFYQYNTGYNGTHPKRYWSVENESFLVEGIDNDETILKEPNTNNLKYIQLNGVSSTGHFYNSETNDIENKNIYDCSFEPYISIDDGEYKLLNSPAVISEVTSSLGYSDSPYGYKGIYFTIPDSYIMDYLLQGHTFKIVIKCIKTPKPEYKKYFSDPSPVITVSPEVCFYNESDFQ